MSRACRCGLLLLVVAACRPETSPPQKLPAPVQVAHAVAEDELATLQLTAAAVARLGIVSEPVERSSIARVRQLGGRALVPPGRTITVRAPVAGYLAGAPPAPGGLVRAGAAAFTLRPFTAPDAQATLASAMAAARGAAGAATARLAAADSAVARAERILRDGAGSERAVEEARAERDAAAAALAAAQAQQAALALDADQRALAIAVPIDGTVTQVHAAAGLVVPAGAPLFEVADDALLWLEVAVYVGELAGLDRAAAVQVGPPGAALAQLARSAAPVQAPPAAQPDAATASLFYAYANADHALRPGERVGVAVPLRDAAAAVASTRASAVVFDVHGGTWVYESVAATTFARRRVEVRAVVAGRALLARGPAPGTPVVTVGAAELFGAEFFEAK